MLTSYILRSYKKHTEKDAKNLAIQKITPKFALQIRAKRSFKASRRGG